MPWHLSIGHRIRRFLKFEYLKINTFAFVGHDEKRIQRARWTASLVTGKDKKLINIGILLSGLNVKFDIDEPPKGAIASNFS